MTVRVRGIYATALTATLGDVVQASRPIRQRFDESFPAAPADVAVETTDDRQGVGVHGAPEQVADITATLFETGIDALGWRDPLPRGGVYAGEVVETLGSGALVDCLPGDDAPSGPNAEQFPACNTTTGFLPYSKTSRRIEEGDRLRVQVIDPEPPWSDSRPVLDTTIRIPGGLADMVRGGGTDTGGPELADIVPADPPEGWAVDWAPAADDAGLDALGAVIETLGERAADLDAAFEDVESPAATAPGAYWCGEHTAWLWFGRESRFALDERRREATATMAGHHRIKAGDERASAAVDFVEDVCAESAAGDFPFDAVTRQFGPTEGDTVSIGHGKPDGRLIDLGPGEVSSRDAEQITVRREMGGSGTYDALGTEQEAGDVAITKFKEGRWWYPTIYRSSDGETKGTYVNICTPVEVFPREVRYVDLHVDVVKLPDGTVERVDDDELDEAVAAGTIPDELAEKARSVAAAVEKAL